jgi:hypothetical protein
MHLSVSELFGPSGLAVVDPDGGHWFFSEAVHGVGCITVDLVPRLVHSVYYHCPSGLVRRLLVPMV